MDSVSALRGDSSSWLHQNLLECSTMWLVAQETLQLFTFRCFHLDVSHVCVVAHMPTWLPPIMPLLSQNHTVVFVLHHACVQHHTRDFKCDDASTNIKFTEFVGSRLKRGTLLDGWQFLRSKILPKTILPTAKTTRRTEMCPACYYLQ